MVNLQARAAAAPRLLIGAASLLLVAAALACSEDGTSGDGTTLEKPRVLIVHSYDNGFRWTARQNEGIIAGLKAGGYDEEAYDLRVFYMDTRVNFVTQERIDLRADIAFQTIAEFKPVLVFLTDDAAVDHVALPYLRANPGSPVTFIFAGVNGDPSRYAPVLSMETPGAQLTGTVERIPFAEGMDAARRVFGRVSRVVIFADDSSSSKAALDRFRQALTAGDATFALQVVDLIQIGTFEDWKDKVEEYRDKADVIGVVNYHRVKDQSGNIANPKDVAKWTIEHSKIPVFGLISDWSADGFVMSFGNSGFETGVFVGRRGADVLAGKHAGTMPIVDPRQYEMTFNLTTAAKLEFELPKAELDRAAETFR